MHLFAYFIVFISIYNHFSKSQILSTRSPEIISTILSILHEKLNVGLILIPIEGIEELEEFAITDLKTIENLQLPYVIFANGSRKNENSPTKKTCISYRFSQPYFVHINTRLPSSWKSTYDSSSWNQWRNMYLQLLGLWEGSQESKMTLITKERLMVKDFFLYIEKQSELIERRQLRWNIGLIPLNTIKLVFNQKLSFLHSNQREKVKEKAHKLKALTQADNLGDTCSFESISIVCPFCLLSDLTFLNTAHNLKNTTMAINGNKTLAKVLKVCYYAAIKLQTNDIELHFSNVPSLHTHHSSLRKDKVLNDIRSLSSFLRKGVFHDYNNPLVFIAHSSEEEESSNILGPFTVASWLGIVLALLTMNNFDESLYEYVVHQLLKILNEDRIKRKKKLASNKVGVAKRTSDDIESGGISQQLLNNRKANHENLDNDDAEEEENPHGRPSKAILHGTIRIVSFLLIATYEGKLYNVITFPKSKLVSSFENLVASDKYSVKITREAEQYRDFGLTQFNKLVQNDSAFKYYDNRNKLASSGLENHRIDTQNSVNIEDCINWVETSANHACVGYEFELRNLRKTHRLDKLVTKSNGKIFRKGIRNFAGRKSSRLFPGAFHISKWIMESGINSVVDSIGPNGKLNESKVFTIKDYLGLFMVYFVLLLFSFILFLSECTLDSAKKRFQLYSIKDYWNFTITNINELNKFLNNQANRIFWKCHYILFKTKVTKIYHC